MEIGRISRSLIDMEIQNISEIPDVKGLYFVGDSTISCGLGTDSAAHGSILCYPRIQNYLHNL